MSDDALDPDAAAALAALRRRVESQSWDAGRDRWQGIRNALEVPPESMQGNCRIPVAVWIVWEREPAEWIDTLAMGWTTTEIGWIQDAVLVELVDKRWRLRGVWVAPGDILRRDGG